MWRPGRQNYYHSEMTTSLKIEREFPMPVSPVYTVLSGRTSSCKERSAVSWDLRYHQARALGFLLGFGYMGTHSLPAAEIALDCPGSWQ